MSSSEYKIVIVGAGGVGKSACCVRFIQEKFLARYDPTIEDSYRKQVEVNGKACVLDLLDTAGQDEYSALREQYMKTGEGFVIIYSITSPATFELVSSLKQNVARYCHGGMPPCILVGNKIDLEEDRGITTEEGKAKAEELNVLFIETSAKENINIYEIFRLLVEKIDEWRKTRNVKQKKKNRNCLIL